MYFFFINLKFILLVQVIKHCMLIKPLVMYILYYFWNSLKNNLVHFRVDLIFTKHLVNNTISLNSKMNVVICGCLLYFQVVFTYVSQRPPMFQKIV